MNKKKIDAVIKKREQRKRFSTWWNNNSYKVMRVIFWFIWIPMLLHEKYINRQRTSFVENPEKTKKLFDKAFPKLVASHYSDPSVIVVGLADYGEYYANDDIFTGYLFSDSCLSKKAKRYFKALSSERREQLFLDYEIEGYKKIIISQDQDWERAAKFFDWSLSYSEPYKAIIFYDESKYPTFKELKAETIKWLLENEV